MHNPSAGVFSTNSLGNPKACPNCFTSVTVKSASGAKFLDHNELETIRETITDDKKTDEELQAIYNTMEIENDREMYGIIVLFLRKFLPSTKVRQISENIVRKII